MSKSLRKLFVKVTPQTFYHVMKLSKEYNKDPGQIIDWLVKKHCVESKRGK